MKYLLPLTFALSFFISVSSCSDNSTGTDPEPETEPEQATGSLNVGISTVGSDKDTDGYQFILNESESHAVEVDDEIALDELEEGSHKAALSGIADNCSLSGETPRSFDITSDETTSISFEVNCESEADDGASEVSNEIVFQSDRDGDDEIFVMDADGSNQKKLTDNSVNDRDPVFSNDGTRIAFISFRNGSSNLYIMDADGSNIQQVTESYDMPFAPRLSWSPEDNKIAFHDKRSGDGGMNSEETYHNEIYIINTDGSDLMQLTDNDAYDAAPSWAPDDDKIVFNSGRDGGVNSDQEIYTMNSDGTDLKRITDDSHQNQEVRWSFDGSKFAFTSNREGNDNIYVMNTDGTELQQITDYAGEDHEAVWSPDDTEILFITNRDLNREVYKANADGSGTPINLTDSDATEEAPYWNSGG